MKKRGGIEYCILLFIITIIFIPIVEAGVGYCVEAAVTDVSPSSVDINEEFTVGVQIENCGDVVPSNIKFEIVSLPADITVKEEMITKIPDLLYSSSERFITYHMRTTSDAKPGTHLIDARLSYNILNTLVRKDYNFTVNVKGEEAELDIASVKTNPVLPYEGSTVELILRIENFGDGSANSVRVYAEHPFQGVKESFVGTLDANEDGPAVFTFIVKRSGEFVFPIKITYKDDFGEHEIETDVSLNVLKKKSDIGVIILTILIIAILGFGIYHFIKTKKEKDEIIQQLLKGNNSGGKNKKFLNKK